MDADHPHYTVLARRFRPQTFAEVVGQEPVARALLNALAAGRVAHAYLFSGARGVGKTSMARILAKALNCPNVRNGEPCNECEICAAIASGHDVDVLEIDGASNRRIDDIRLLRSNVGVKPMRARYKVYIIDEVHMLTNEAFNALLKTLEEPPPNVKFIFCTTEPNEVPETILSRCQRFDFAAIGTQQIVQRLREIAEAEGYTVDAAALELLARRAGGSMRDSQSLLDQVLAYGGQTITAEDVHRLLGTASDETLIELADAIIDRRTDRVLERFDKALADGAQLGEFIDQLLNYARDLMVIAAGAQSTALLAVAASHHATLSKQAENWGLPTILAALQILSETKTRMQRSGHGRALAELALVRLTLLEAMLDLVTLVDDLRAGTGQSPGSGPAARPSREPPPSTRGERADRQKGAPKSPQGAEQRGDRPRDSAKTAPLQFAEGSQAESAAAEPGEGSPSGVPNHATVSLARGTESEFWSHLVSRLALRDILRDAASKAANIAISGPNQLEIIFPPHYHLCVGLCEQPANLSRLEKLAGELAGRPIRITCRIDERLKAEDPPLRSSGGPASSGNGSGVSQLNDPYAETARAIFGATIARVEKLPSSRAGSARDED